jgi:hypothetical protein
MGLLMWWWCRGRARIVAEDISANIKHKLTKDQKKVVVVVVVVVIILKMMVIITITPMSITITNTNTRFP